MFFDIITPRQQCFYACGLIFVVRHIQQYHVQILEHVQVIGFCSFDDAVHDSTGSGSGFRCMEQECFPADGITFRPPFCCVVGDFTSSVKKIVAKCLPVIPGILYCLFQFASPGRRNAFQPLPEIIPDWHFQFQAF